MLVASISGQADADADVKNEIWVLELSGALGPAKADFIGRNIEAAAEAGAVAVVIRMDTPGGLDASMRDLVKAILASRVPVITFVAPNGARAASAGTYIAYVSHIAAMAPATNIGSSTPVSIGGPPSIPDLKPSGPDPASDADQNDLGNNQDDQATDRVPVDDMQNKIINDAVAYLQGLAELRGRNVQWAEQTVRNGANIRASEALALGVVDFVASDLPDLLVQIDGTSLTMDGDVVVMQVGDAELVQIETDWRHDLLEIVTDPTVAYALLIFGIWGLILEFYSPGMILPSVFGVVCLLLGAYGLQMLPVNYAGVALIIVGIAFMVVEIITPTLGVLGVTGVVAFVFGSLMLMDTQVPEYQLPLGIVGGVTAFTVFVALLTAGFLVRARRSAVTTGASAMVGTPAEETDDFVVDREQQVGRVRAAGEIWRASAACSHPGKLIRKGDTLTVEHVDGLELSVAQEE